MSRTSSAMCRSATGLYESVGSDLPRFDHDPETFKVKGLLIEGAGTNLLRYDRDMSAGPWSRLDATLSGESLTGPDGSTVPGWSVGSGYFYQDFTVSAGQTYTISLWLRTNVPTALGLRRLYQGNEVSFLSSTTWTRHQIQGTASSSSARFLLDARSSNGFGGAGLLLYIWNTQVELGSVATSPMLSSSSTASRAPDLPSISGYEGIYDVRLIYDDMTMDVLSNETVASGWWPAQVRPHLREISLFQPGSLGWG